YMFYYMETFSNQNHSSYNSYVPLLRFYSGMVYTWQNGDIPLSGSNPPSFVIVVVSLSIGLHKIVELILMLVAINHCRNGWCYVVSYHEIPIDSVINAILFR